MKLKKIFHEVYEELRPSIIYLGYILGWMIAIAFLLIGALNFKNHMNISVICLCVGIVASVLLLEHFDTFRDVDEELDAGFKAAKEERNKEKKDRINSIMAEISQLNDELIQNYKIIEENKKAIFGAKAKARKKAEARIRSLEAMIEDKTKEAQKIKKRIED